MSVTPPSLRPLSRALGGLAWLSGIALSCSLTIWLLRFALSAWASSSPYVPLGSWLPVAIFLPAGIYLTLKGWRVARGQPLGIWTAVELLLLSVVAWGLLYFGFIEPWLAPSPGVTS